MPVTGLPTFTDPTAATWADDYDPAVHAYDWQVWRLPGLPDELYLRSTEADLERMERHRAKMLESTASGQGGKFAAGVLSILR